MLTLYLSFSNLTPSLGNYFRALSTDLEGLMVKVYYFYSRLVVFGFPFRAQTSLETKQENINLYLSGILELWITYGSAVEPMEISFARIYEFEKVGLDLFVCCEIISA